MKKLILSIILIVTISCKNDILVNPNSIKEAKECRKYIRTINGCSSAFIKKFAGDNSVILIDNNKYFIQEVYLTYMVNHDTVFNHAVNLIFKTYNYNTKQFECPDYTKFEIIADSKYTLGDTSNNLVAHDIPVNTSHFQLVYYDNKLRRVINFREK